MRKRKLFYPAGLISLILLPAICIWFLNKNNAFEQLHLLPVVVWSPSPYFNFSDSDSILLSHPEINYARFDLTGNDQADNHQINLAQSEIRKIAKSNDQNNGIHFHFEDQSKFWTFIKAIDACKIEKIKTFVPEQNDLWVFNPRPVKQVDEFEDYPVITCGYMEAISPKAEAERIQRERDEKNAYLVGLMKTHSISISLFLMLIILSVRKIRKQASHAS